MSETGIRSLTAGLFAILVLGAVVGSIWTNLLLWICVAVVAVTEWRRPLVDGKSYSSFLFAGLMVTLIFVNMSMVWSPEHGFNPSPMLTCIALIWTNDTGAYLVGKPMGKHKLLPSVSPGKSWEGLVGGVFLSSVVSGLLMGWNHAWIGGGLGLVATAGDLLESSWKRGHGIKDSGTILPGHGGVLDRFDGFVLAAPLFALLMYFLDVDLFFNSWFL